MRASAALGVLRQGRVLFVLEQGLRSVADKDVDAVAVVCVRVIKSGAL